MRVELTPGAIADLSGASLKRVAWLYGCAAKGSDEERVLEAFLIEKIRKMETPQ